MIVLPFCRSFWFSSQNQRSAFNKKHPGQWDGATRLCAATVGVALVLGMSCSLAVAEDKKEEPKKEPPQALIALPFAVSPGATTTLKIRGLNLTNVSEVRFPEFTNAVSVTIKSQGKVEVPKQTEAKNVGDTQLEIELSLPTQLPGKTLAMIIKSPEGESAPYSLLVVDPSQVIEEKEENGSFRQTQEIPFAKIIAGSIHQPHDVDLFRFSGKSGQAITSQITAAAHGSVMDAVLTLYDEQGTMIAWQDDGSSRDAQLKATLPKDGIYYLAVTDAHDKGSLAHVYYLSLKPQ